MVIRILICLILLFIVIQDFRFRAVHWIMFPMLWILLIADGLFVTNEQDYISGTAINILIIIIQGMILYGFYQVQGKNLNFIITRIIGIGDVLFIFLMAFAFTWTSFMFYYIAGLLFALLAWIIIRKINREETGLVPLAGLLAIYMIIIMLIDIVLPEYSRDMEIFGRLLTYGS